MSDSSIGRFISQDSAKHTASKLLEQPGHTSADRAFLEGMRDTPFVADDPIADNARSVGDVLRAAHAAADTKGGIVEKGGIVPGPPAYAIPLKSTQKAAPRDRQLRVIGTQ
jgi:hypothetical protein